MTISARLLNLSKEKGIAQKDIAKVLDVAPSTVNTWIKTNSDSIPSAYIMPLCHLLGVQPEELLEGTKQEKDADVSENSTQLSENEQRLLSIFRCLDAESQIVVLNAAIVEKRAAATKGDDGSRTSTPDLGAC